MSLRRLPLLLIASSPSVGGFSIVRKIGSHATGQSRPPVVESPPPELRPMPSPSFNVASVNQDPSAADPRNQQLDNSFIGKTGGQIFHEMMIKHDVKHIFGYPGGAILPVFDAIYNSRDFDFVLARHEQGAGHMAEGYARASGKPGIVLVTSGPGATNVITPMADAYADGVPMIVFTGQVSTTAIGSDAFQEADILGISRGCTKWNVMVRSVGELPRRINEAFEIATSGRPGPVLVDLPRDVTARVLRRAIEAEPKLPSNVPSTAMQSAAHTRQQQEATASIHRVAELINIANQPVIYAGHGVICSENGTKLLRDLAAKSSIPVTTSLHGLGAFDELDEKSLHMLGMHGSAYANMAMQEADLIIALGSRFDDRVTCNQAKFAPQAKAAAAEGRGGVVHFDIMHKNINKVVHTVEGVVGDLGANLKQLLPLVQEKSMSTRHAWFDKIRAWKAKWPLSAYTEAESPSGAIRPQKVIAELSKLTDESKENTYITTGVGQHQMWAAQHYRWRFPRTMISSGGLGTMGFGLPAAIGAKAAKPDALVIDIDGDASFGMSLTELSTAQQFGIGVKVIILNNEEQGIVTQWQSLFYNGRYSHTHHQNPDFVTLANAMGVQAQRVVTRDSLVDALKWLIKSDGPALLEIVTEQKLSVLPMVPAGCGLHEFVV